MLASTDRAEHLISVTKSKLWKLEELLEILIELNKSATQAEDVAVVVADLEQVERKVVANGERKLL